MIDLKQNANISIGFFLVAALLGVFLRFLFVFDMSVDYRYVVHTHSHIALLGWVYVALITLFYKLYLTQGLVEKHYRIIFWSTLATLFGMMFSFPFQGYALFSILFSTLFLFTSYWYFWFFIRNIPDEFKSTKSYRCIKASLWYMVISSIGPWALGAIMSVLGSDSIWYRIAIYFYLHFQYNGWMILSLVGVLFYIIESYKLVICDQYFNWFFRAINLGIIFSFFLSVLWTEPSAIYYYLSGIGGVIQLLAFMILVKIIKSSKLMSKTELTGFQKQLLWSIGGLIMIKIVLQLFSTFPYVADLAATIIDFTIGYLHWTFLGVISISLFLFLDYFKLSRIPPKAYYIYITGFLLTEGLIFYKGMVVWRNWVFFKNYFFSLSIASVIVFIGILWFFLHNLRCFSGKLNKKKH